MLKIKTINAPQSSLSPWDRQHCDTGVLGPSRISHAVGLGMGPRDLHADGQVSVIQAKFGRVPRGKVWLLSHRFRF